MVQSTSLFDRGREFAHYVIMDTHPAEFGEDYFTSLGDSDSVHLEPEHDLILTLMPPRPHDRILDVGCGKGRLTLLLQKIEPSIDMVSSDVTSEARKYIQGTFVQCSMTKMPFPNDTFDKIFCLHVIAHFKEGEKGIREAYRILKPGGTLMILTPNKSYVYVSWIATLLKRFRFKYDRTARWLYSKRTLDKLVRTCPWMSIEHSYFQGAPRTLPFEWMRAKLIVVAQK